MYYQRFLKLQQEAEQRSLFLFGPRLTGKTSLLKNLFPDSPYYNLLLSDLFLRVSRRPQIIREELLAQKGSLIPPIIIDEIQKLPLLLDEVHNLIEETGLPFILTGSSSRKLIRSGANLLGGRARTRHLYPFVSKEIVDFDLFRSLNYGAIPSIYLSNQPEADLRAYCGNYLQTEIQAEGVVRNIENFSRFLTFAALSNSELLNFENIARDSQLPPRTIREYFHILEDTLIGTMLFPFQKTTKRKAISTAKFYFFDIGVSNTLANRYHITAGSELFGKCLEHFIFTELKAYLDYTQDQRQLSFWRTRSGIEVDFIIGQDTAIEVKGTSLVNKKHLKGILALSEELPLRHKIVVSLDASPRQLQGITILPVKNFLETLWSAGLRS